jgi:hypothetical protein
MEFCYSGGYYTLNSGGKMKEYVLKIGYNPVTEEIEYVKEYIEGSKATLHIDDEEIELDDELAGYVVSDVIGIA